MQQASPDCDGTGWGGGGRGGTGYAQGCAKGDDPEQWEDNELAQLVERPTERPGAGQTWVRFPRAARDFFFFFFFFSKSASSADSYGVRTTL